MAAPGRVGRLFGCHPVDPDGAEVVLSFDGSFNGDTTTVLTVATVDQRPHVDLVELWEAAGHQVPIVDVEPSARRAGVGGCWRSPPTRSGGHAPFNCSKEKASPSWSIRSPPAG